jgi:hypothetical protein
LPVTISSLRWFGETAISTACRRRRSACAASPRTRGSALQLADVDAEGQAGLLVGDAQRLVEAQQLPGREGTVGDRRSCSGRHEVSPPVVERGQRLLVLAALASSPAVTCASYGPGDPVPGAVLEHRRRDRSACRRRRRGR